MNGDRRSPGLVPGIATENNAVADMTSIRVATAKPPGLCNESDGLAVFAAPPFGDAQHIPAMELR
jgi:hypothetical protein